MMSKEWILRLACISFASLAIGQETKANEESKEVVKKEQVRVLPVNRTPESESVMLAITLPKPKEIVTPPIWAQFRIEWYALGAGSSQFDRADEIAVSDMGQTVHVVVDNLPYFAVNEPAINPFNEEGDYRITNYKFLIPFPLKEGMHTLRMFPARSFGESLKGSNTFQTLSFQVGKEAKSGLMVDWSSPYLTYNEPSDALPLTSHKPILLDFLISNCELTPDGYKVRLSIDGQVNRVLTSWQPYYIYGLKRGKHVIRLELIDENNLLVKGPFNDTERTIYVR